MRKKITILMMVALLVTCLALPVAAANDPTITMVRTAVSGGKCTVTLAFKDIPQGNPVEYAQILLTSRSSQCDIVKDSLSMQVSGDMLVTKQYNTTADSLLVLIEPTKSSFPGIGECNVFTFTVKSTSATVNPSFDVSAILILKDGTEKEINQTVSVTVPDPCDGGHNFVGGSCTRCGAADPNYQPPSSSSQKPTSSSSTQPSSSSSPSSQRPTSNNPTQPDASSSSTYPHPSVTSRPTVSRPTQSSPNTNQTTADNQTGKDQSEKQSDEGMDASLILLIIVCVMVLGAGGFCLYLLLSKKK